MTNKQVEKLELEQLRQEIENEGWFVTIEEDTMYSLSKFSPAGHDFFITVHFDGTREGFIDELEKMVEAFDISYETYLHLDEEGHGRNGAPYDMRDVYNDIEASYRDMVKLTEKLQ